MINPNILPQISHHFNIKTIDPDSKSKPVLETAYKAFSDLIIKSGYKTAKIASGFTIGTGAKLLQDIDFNKILNKKICQTNLKKFF